MALDDILFEEGDGEDMVVEIPLGVLNSPIDIVFEAGNAQGSALLEMYLPSPTEHSYVFVT